MQPPHVAFGAVAQGLVILHALVALALCGAATHHLVVAVGYLRGVYRVRLGRIYALVTACCYVAVFALGMLAYPSYRYFVRGLYFDRHVIWASNLFDIKENYAALGLPFALALLLLSRSFEPSRDRDAGRALRHARRLRLRAGLVHGGLRPDHHAAARGAGVNERRPVADFAGCCAMVVASSTAFLVMGLVPLRKLWYHPLERGWTLEVSSRMPASMDFYGRALYAAIAAALAFFAGRALGRRLDLAKVSRERLWYWLACALAFTFLAMCLFGYQLWPRPPQPLPIPEWYQPH